MRFRIEIHLCENMPAAITQNQEIIMNTIKGPALFLAQFAGDDAPFTHGTLFPVTYS